MLIGRSYNHVTIKGGNITSEGRGMYPEIIFKLYFETSSVFRGDSVKVKDYLAHITIETRTVYVA